MINRQRYFQFINDYLQLKKINEILIIQKTKNKEDKKRFLLLQKKSRLFKLQNRLYRQLERQFKQLAMLSAANWYQAKLHAQAMIPGIVNREIESRKCHCCNAQIDKEQIPMSENIKQLAILGPGFPLYFIFLKYSVIMIFLLSVSYSALTLYWAYIYNYNFCIKDAVRTGKANQPIHCTSWMVLLSRLEIDVDVNQNILRITSFVTQLFFLIYIRELLRKHNAYFHEREPPKISDYSVMIKNIPKQNQIKQKITTFFKESFEEKYKIEFIRPIAYLEQLQTNHDLIQSEQKRYFSLYAKNQRDENDLIELNKIQQNINQLHIQDINREKQIAQSIENDQVECQRAIVILNTENQKQSILKEKVNVEISSKVFGHQAKKIEIVAAPEPDEIILSNINIPKSMKIRRIILGWTLFVFLLAAVTGLFYVILSRKAKQIQKSLQIYKSDKIASANLRSYALVLVLTSIVLIVLFNKFLLSTILHKITELERHKTAAGLELSFSIKYALGLVFTTAILTLLVENIKFHNIYQHDYGVIEQQTMMYFFAAFFVPFIWLVNPWYIFKRAKMFVFDGSPLLTQNQANQIAEFPEYNIGKRYAEIIEMVWFTYFYASLIPIGAPLALIGASLFYWVDKYNLLRKSSVKQNISSDFSMRALIMLDLTLILKPVGQIVFDMQIRDEWNYQSVILIFIGIVYVCLPKDIILDWINGEKFQLYRESYKQIENNGKLQMYSKLNPQRIYEKDRLKFEYSSEKKKQTMGIISIPSCDSDSGIETIGIINRQHQCPQQFS